MSREKMYSDPTVPEEKKEEASPLILDMEQENLSDKCFSKWMNMFGYTNKNSRVIFLNGRTSSSQFPKNAINNQKYNIFTFIPKVLFNQFRQFYNLFFLLICISQLFPLLRIGFIVTYVTPLLFVLTITLLKEGIDDFKRYRRDTEINNEIYQKLGPFGEFTPITSAQIKVGDIIKLQEKRRIPADMVLLHTTDTKGCVFIKTDQLDGETDWKLRKSIHKTQSVDSISLLPQLNACVRAQAPHKDIYKFQGTFFIKEGDFESFNGLELENTVWANTVLANGSALGLVIYSGSETKSQLNSRDPRTKTGKIDDEMSFMSFILFLLLAALSLVILTLNGFKENWYIMLMRYILLLSYIIPISLRVNLDLAKTWYSWNISTDTKIQGAIARNTTIPEELGRVQMLFSDKTGTLTKNEMKFKSLYVNDSRYDKKDSIEEIKKILSERLNFDSGLAAQEEPKIAKGIQRYQEENLIKDLILSLSICHNVTPVKSENPAEEKTEYQASSPDEIALVKFAEEMQCKLIYRDQQIISIQLPNGEKEDYEILIDFPFSSETKRMGIIVKHVKTGRIILLIKGAESVICTKVKNESASKIKEAAENLSLEGLRTLAFAEKLLTLEEYENWRKQYEIASAAENDREQQKLEVRELLENNLNYVGVTGVEDTLQDNVAGAVEALKQAGVKVWMLTGDKIETACCIGISSGFKSRTEKYVYIQDALEGRRSLGAELEVIFLV